MLLAQITDLHIGITFRDAPADFSATTALRRIIEAINTLQPRPDIVVLTGDLTADGKLEEYVELQHELSLLESPYYLVPGNHDHRANMAAVFSQSDALVRCADPTQRCNQVIDWDDNGQAVRLIGLDTLVPNDHGGAVDDVTCDWLHEKLSERSDCRTLLFLHHPPFISHMPIFDAMRCRTQGRLEAVLDEVGDSVELILCGHVHRPIQTSWCGKLTVALPSTCFQYPLSFSRQTDTITPQFEKGVIGLCQIVAGHAPVAHQLSVSI